ncbi:MAG: alanine--glyoxylate aminotransferase family protein [Saprospiraceae bacterium]|nr:alanine--glyoxylate aminotransferase family protein [Saprospiraceae bacterium]
MPGLLSNVDPKGLLEYSVVYTDRALNHMSQSFQEVMREISSTLKQVYQADAVVIVPGSGTFGMEAVARQFARGKKCLVVRNGWFSYRWTEILDMGNIPSESIVMKAQRIDTTDQPAFAPAPIETVISTIKSQKPSLVFAPHVETSAGMILPFDYLKAIGEAVHSVGGLFVLDCIASGTIWVDMKKAGVDVLISAPQKGWSGPPCCGLLMMSEKAIEAMESTSSDSFACDLKKWSQIMQAYLNGGHAYHATMPTDALHRFCEVMKETVDSGLLKVRDQQQELGDKVRALLETKGFKSVASEGFQAPGVVVCYTDDPDIKSGRKFKEAGLQIAAGVPLKCDEPTDFQTFRLGLFGLDKLQNIDRTVEKLRVVLEKIT